MRGGSGRGRASVDDTTKSRSSSAPPSSRSSRISGTDVLAKIQAGLLVNAAAAKTSLKTLGATKQNLKIAQNLLVSKAKPRPKSALLTKELQKITNIEARKNWEKSKYGDTDISNRDFLTAEWHSIPRRSPPRGDIQKQIDSYIDSIYLKYLKNLIPRSKPKKKIKAAVTNTNSEEVQKSLYREAVRDNWEECTVDQQGALLGDDSHGLCWLCSFGIGFLAALQGKGTATNPLNPNDFDPLVNSLVQQGWLDASERDLFKRFLVDNFGKLNFSGQAGSGSMHDRKTFEHVAAIKWAAPLNLLLKLMGAEFTWDFVNINGLPYYRVKGHVDGVRVEGERAHNHCNFCKNHDGIFSVPSKAKNVSGFYPNDRRLKKTLRKLYNDPYGSSTVKVWWKNPGLFTGLAGMTGGSSSSSASEPTITVHKSPMRLYLFMLEMFYRWVSLMSVSGSITQVYKTKAQSIASQFVFKKDPTSNNILDDSEGVFSHIWARYIIVKVNSRVKLLTDHISAYERVYAPETYVIQVSVNGENRNIDCTRYHLYPMYCMYFAIKSIPGITNENIYNAMLSVPGTSMSDIDFAFRTKEIRDIVWDNNAALLNPLPELPLGTRAFPVTPFISDNTAQVTPFSDATKQNPSYYTPLTNTDKNFTDNTSWLNLPEPPIAGPGSSSNPDTLVANYSTLFDLLSSNNPLNYSPPPAIVTTATGLTPKLDNIYESIINQEESVGSKEVQEAKQLAPLVYSLSQQPEKWVAEEELGVVEEENEENEESGNSDMDGGRRKTRKPKSKRNKTKKRKN